MNYNYTGSGSVKVGGCPGYKWVAYYRYEFAKGSTLYFKPKAKRGIFEKIVIKDVRFPKRINPNNKFVCNSCKTYPLYVDTYNALFNSNELITYEEAVILVKNYQEEYRRQLENASINGI